jgi:toxin ParE1/3/4
MNAAVEEMLAAITEMPGIGAASAFCHPLLAGLRMLPVRGFDRHLIYYRPIADTIELIRVYHAARNVDEIDPSEQGKRGE